MADVGIRELKARLSKYVERASRGEIIRITDHGKPTAVLGPLPGSLRLEEGIAAGWVRPPAEKAHGPWRRFRASKTVADLLSEDRGA